MELFWIFTSVLKTGSLVSDPPGNPLSTSSSVVTISGRPGCRRGERLTFLLHRRQREDGDAECGLLGTSRGVDLYMSLTLRPLCGVRTTRLCNVFVVLHDDTSTESPPGTVPVLVVEGLVSVRNFTDPPRPTVLSPLGSRDALLSLPESRFSHRRERTLPVSERVT